MKHRQPPRSWFAEHAGQLGSWLLLALILAFAVWWYVRPVRAGDIRAWEECRAAYARAVTRMDTIAVDQRRPINTRGDAPAALTCRTLRESGQFR